MRGNAEREPLPAEKPFLRFVYLQHGWLPEDPEFLLRQFADVELIFLEVVGLSGHERQRLEDQFNLALADPDKLSAKKIAWQSDTIGKLSRKKFGLNFMSNLAALLARSGKTAKLVDISSENPLYESFQAAKNEQDVVNLLLRERNITAAKRVLTESCRHFGNLNRQREELVRDQIRRVCARRQGAGKPLRAVVVQGLAHHPTAGLFDRQKYQVETVFVPVRIPLTTQLEIQLRLGETPPEADYARALLVNFILPLALQQPPGSFFRNIEYIERLVDNLSGDQYAGLLAELDQMARRKIFLRTIAVSLLGLARDWSEENQISG
jgi:hypothetical protein